MTVATKTRYTPSSSRLPVRRYSSLSVVQDFLLCLRTIRREIMGCSDYWSKLWQVLDTRRLLMSENNGVDILTKAVTRSGYSLLWPRGLQPTLATWAIAYSGGNTFRL